MTIHSRLSPSSSSRWLNCTGSIVKCKNILSVSSDAASLGTKLHELAENIITNALTGKEIEYVSHEYINTYVSYVLNLVKEYGVAIHLEHSLVQLDYDGEYPCFGTADAVLEYDDHIDIVDLKTGFVPVSAVGNTQLLVYAYLASEMFDKPVGKIVICQRDEVKTWELEDQSMIYKIGIAIARVQHLLAKGIYKFSFGDHCKFCPAKFECDEYAKAVVPAISTLPSVSGTEEDLSTLYAMKNYLSEYIKKIDDLLKHRLIACGEKSKGLKVIRGRGRRSWDKPNKEIEKMLLKKGFSKEDIFNTSLASFTKIEKLSEEGKEFVEENTSHVAGGYKIVLESQIGEPVEMLVGDTLSALPII